MSYNQIVDFFKRLTIHQNQIISIIYVFTPMFIAYLIEMTMSQKLNWLARSFLGLFLIITISCNYIIYNTISSVTVFNKVIAGKLYPLIIGRKITNVTSMNKLDNFIARLNKDFLGFRCFYIKFKKLSFYQYILGVSTSYFLVNGIVNKNKSFEWNFCLTQIRIELFLFLSFKKCPVLLIKI